MSIVFDFATSTRSGQQPHYLGKISRLAFEDLLGYCNSRHCLWPASVEREVRNDLFQLRFCQAIFFRLVEMERQLFTVPASNKRSNGNETTVTWRQLLSFPDVAKQDIVSK